MKYVCLFAGNLQSGDWVFDTPVDKQVKGIIMTERWSRILPIEIEFTDGSKKTIPSDRPVHVQAPITGRCRRDVECYNHSMSLWAWRAHIKDYTCK